MNDPKTGNPALDAVLEDMLAYEAARFDPEPDAFFVDVGDMTYGPYPDRESAQAWINSLGAGFPDGAAAIRGEATTDLNVSGADLVDAFTQWREQLKAALADQVPAPHPLRTSEGDGAKIDTLDVSYLLTALHDLLAGYSESDALDWATREAIDRVADALVRDDPRDWPKLAGGEADGE